MGRPLHHDMPLSNAVCAACPFPKCSPSLAIIFFPPKLHLAIRVNLSALISRVQAQICPYPADTLLVSRIWRRNIWHKPGRRRTASPATAKHCQASWWRSPGAQRPPGQQRRWWGRDAGRQRQCRGPARHCPSDAQVGRLCVHGGWVQSHPSMSYDFAPLQKAVFLELADVMHTWGLKKQQGVQTVIDLDVCFGSVSHEGWSAGHLARVMLSHLDSAGVEFCPEAVTFVESRKHMEAVTRAGKALAAWALRLRAVTVWGFQKWNTAQGRTLGPGEASRKMAWVEDGYEMQKHLTSPDPRESRRWGGRWFPSALTDYPGSSVPSKICALSW